MDDATLNATTPASTSAPAPAPRAAAAMPAPQPAPAAPAVGDEIDGVGVVFGVRVIRDDGTYVQIGSGDASWIKV